MHAVRILVTGGTGHTGQRVVRRLAELGNTVRVLTREPTKLPTAMRRQLEMFRADVNDSAALADAVSGCDAVVAMTHIRYAPNVIAAMKSAGVRRVVFTSSTRRFTKFPEETAHWVIRGEEAVEQSGLDWTIIRASMIYGDNLDNNLTHLVRVLEALPVHPLIGGGKMLWQPVFTWDVVQAIVAALERPVSVGKAYTVAGPAPISYEEMVRTILVAMGKRRLLFPVPMGIARAAARVYGLVSSKPRLRIDQIDRLQENKVFDISEAVRDMGFEPVTFEEGIRRKIAKTV